MEYRVWIKGWNKKDIKASNELEARVKYCEGQGFNYKIYANKLKIEKKGKEKQNE